VHRLGPLLDWAKNEKLKPAPLNKTENITLTVLWTKPEIEA
jgi:hypothetical protein